MPGSSDSDKSCPMTESEEPMVGCLNEEEACLIAMTGDHLSVRNENLFPLNPKNDFEYTSLENLNDNLNNIIYTDPTPINPNPERTDQNLNLINYALDNTTRNSDGRLVIPLFWNPAIKHQLSQNYKLAFSMLNSTLKKLKSTKDALKQVNDVFLEQEGEGIIERINDLPDYLKTHPNCAFLAHMPVIRQDAKSTKVRMVFLPTQRERANSNSTEVFSNNQCIMAGPNLNHKIVTAVHNLRFGKYLLTYDLRKAFLNIELPEHDKNKLLFLWFKDVNNGNFEPVAFRNARLAFGLKCSPAILTIALFKILIVDAENDDSDLQRFKKHMFHQLYVDNGAVLTDSVEKLREAKIKCEEIFKPYCFSLQQFVTNDNNFQSEIDNLNADLEPTPQTGKLLGVQWDRIKDSLGPKLIKLNSEASTKRQVLQTLNSIYDILGLYLPVVNKAKEFMQRLSLIKNLKWDDKLSNELLREWRYICRYVNQSGSMETSRNIGDKNDEYSLVCFTDASKLCYGIVMYIINVTQNKVHFLFASNHFNSLQLRHKTIPELEMRGVAYGSTKLIETYQNFTGTLAVEPINITKLLLFNDSMNTLQRINTSLIQFGKLKGPSPFVKNAILKISKNCNICPIQFGFVSGGTNPADHVTRIMRYEKLTKSNYLTGPAWLLNDTDDLRYKFLAPHPLSKTFSELSGSDELTGEVDAPVPAHQSELESPQTSGDDCAAGVDVPITPHVLSEYLTNDSVGDSRKSPKTFWEDSNELHNCHESLPKQLDLDEISSSHPKSPKTFGNEEMNDSDSVVEEVSPVNKSYSAGDGSQVTSYPSSDTMVLEKERPQPSGFLCATGVSDNDWDQSMETLFNKYSAYRKPISVIRYVLQFINGFKRRVKQKLKNDKLRQKLTVLERTENFYSLAIAKVWQIEQTRYFPDVYKYLLDPNVANRDIPAFVLKYNPVLADGLIRVKAKTRCDANEFNKLPILISKHSNITKLLIEKIHDKSGHGGVYSVLNKLYKSYFLETHFSVVSKILKQCVNCGRHHKRTIKLNQNSYREFRSNPCTIPFRTVFLDHLGPYSVYTDETKKHKTQVHVLLFTCLWSRAINLKLCTRVDTDCFLRAFQDHVLDYGLPEVCLSDLGSSIVAGSNIIQDYLSDPITHNYLTENQIKTPTFDQYAKGNSALGSLVECCVKMIKLYNGKVFKKRVLTLENFRYLVNESQHFTNKRPIAFKESLRQMKESGNIEPITPEILLKGYSTNSISIAPSFNVEPPDWVPNNANDIRETYKDLNSSREYLRELYHTEFVQSLIHQAVDRPDRYEPVQHRPLKTGDIVLIKEKMFKPLNYPLAIVTKVEYNDIGESVAAYLKKGATRELTYRHASTLILLIPNEDAEPVNSSSTDENLDLSPTVTDSNINHVNKNNLQRPVRKAATACKELIKTLIQRDAVSAVT